MTVVLVHGNPETTAIWGPLRTVLGRDDVRALSPPGFGAAVPEGFGATSDDYVAWLIGELEAIGEPVDLVGHDWGGGHVARVACARPDLLHSWVTDVAGLFDPAYVWHDFAQVWQTPGAGEENIESMLAVPAAERAALYESLGMTPDVAANVASNFTAEMGRCILALYRSAAQPRLSEWGKDFEAAGARPGLVITAADDPFTGGPEMSRRSAERAKARFVVLEGVGHWWMLQDPAAGARALNEFWECAQELGGIDMT
jgi:pimeloyl-ACP methyl ester carboxylesterase